MVAKYDTLLNNPELFRIMKTVTRVEHGRKLNVFLLGNRMMMTPSLMDVYPARTVALFRFWGVPVAHCDNRPQVCGSDKSALSESELRWVLAKQLLDLRVGSSHGEEKHSLFFVLRILSNRIGRLGSRRPDDAVAAW